jgi:hypothetical protein
MSVLTDIFNADVAAVIGEIPAQLRIGGAGGAVLTGSRVPMRDTQAMEDAGFLQRFDFEIMFAVSAFTVAKVTIPAVRDTAETFEPARAAWIPCQVGSRWFSQDGICVHFGMNQSI